MKKAIWLLVCVFLVNLATSQSSKSKTCSSKKILTQNLNSINNKCQTVNTNVKNKNIFRHVTLKQSNTKGRYLVKRRKQIAKTIKVAKTKGLANENKNSYLPEALKVSKITRKVYQLYDVDYVPLFKSCEKAPEKEQLKCFNAVVGNHIQNNFEYPEEAIEKEIVGHITVKFVVNENGKVTNVKANDGSYEDTILTKYSEELISKLPNLKPAKKRNKKVAVSYELQLDFSL